MYNILAQQYLHCGNVANLLLARWQLRAQLKKFTQSNNLPQHTAKQLYCIETFTMRTSHTRLACGNISITVAPVHMAYVKLGACPSWRSAHAKGRARRFI